MAAPPTPPRSQQNTPLRPEERPVQPSPSTSSAAPRPPQASRPLDTVNHRGIGYQGTGAAHRPAIHDYTLDDDMQGEEYDNAFYEEAIRQEGLIGESDIDSDDLPDEEGPGGEDDVEMADEAEPEEGVRLDTSESTREAQSGVKAGGPPTTPAKRTARGKAKAAHPRREKKGAELYESDIVARWNEEIGDLCQRPPRVPVSGA